jgi:PiT family inorganic phosphate transporter
MNLEFLVLVVVVVTALGFDFTNGFHDTSNAVATSVATGALSPRAAVAMSATLNFVGALLSVQVAATVAKGIVNLGGVRGQALLVIVLAGLAGAILWNLLTWWAGLPSSSAHALFGGLIGATLIAVGLHGVIWSTGVISKILIPGVLAPPVAALIAACGTRLVYRITDAVPDTARERGFRWGQVGSSALVSLANGANDAQKTMGVVLLALIAHGTLSTKSAMPPWVKLSCAAAIGIGTYCGGWRVMRTLGKGLVEISSLQGLAAESSSAAVVLTSSTFGIPLATTQAVTGSVLGAGLGRPGAAVRWHVAGRMGVAWLLTVPGAALIAAAGWAVAHLIGGLAGVLALFALLLAAAAAIYLRSQRTRVDTGNVNAAWADDRATAAPRRELARYPA